MKQKIFLCGMSGLSEEDCNNVSDIVVPIIDKIDGIVWTLNYNSDSDLEEIFNEDVFFENQRIYNFLNKNKKNGKITLNQWNFRNDFCRNAALFNGALKNGDWFILIDTLERLSSEFFHNIEDLLNWLEQNQVDGVTLHGKRFLFKYNDYLRFQGNPHEGLHGANRIIELTQIEQYKDSSKYFHNIRNEKRDEFHFIDAYLKYYFCYPDSNHCLLGCEDNQDLFRSREIRRRQFRFYCQQNNINTLEELKNYIIKNEYTIEFKEFLQKEKILNTAYAYYILGERSSSELHSGVHKHDQFFEVK